MGGSGTATSRLRTTRIPDYARISTSPTAFRKCEGFESRVIRALYTFGEIEIVLSSYMAALAVIISRIGSH